MEFNEADYPQYPQGYSNREEWLIALGELADFWEKQFERKEIVNE